MVRAVRAQPAAAPSLDSAGEPLRSRRSSEGREGDEAGEGRRRSARRGYWSVEVLVTSCWLALVLEMRMVMLLPPMLRRGSRPGSATPPPPSTCCLQRSAPNCSHAATNTRRLQSAHTHTHTTHEAVRNNNSTGGRHTRRQADRQWDTGMSVRHSTVYSAMQRAVRCSCAAADWRCDELHSEVSNGSCSADRRDLTKLRRRVANRCTQRPLNNQQHKRGRQQAKHSTQQQQTEGRTGQDRTGQDRTGQDRTGQDRTGQVSTALATASKPTACTAPSPAANTVQRSNAGRGPTAAVLSVCLSVCLTVFALQAVCRCCMYLPLLLLLRSEQHAGVEDREEYTARQAHHALLHCDGGRRAREHAQCSSRAGQHATTQQQPR